MAAGTTGTLLADRYRVLRRLGSGGMATVVLAEDERLGRKVAVKRLHSESAEDTAKRFVREARLGASLNHPNIVSVYDTVTDDEGVLLVMEYVEGETLRDAIARGPLEPDVALRVLRGIASALDHSHEHGVVHRDVKPANILIARDGTAKLADLGIASAAERTRITRSGTVLGTAPYIAPERLEGGTGGPAADIYALAAVAYEALAGRKAVQGATPVEVARRIVSEPPPDLARDWPDAPREASAVLKRGLAKDPADRPATAGELVRDLERALGGGPTRPTVPLAGRTGPPPERDRRPLLLAAAVAAIVLAVVLIATLGGGGGSGGNTTPKKAATGAKTAQRPSTQRQASTPSAPAADPGHTLSDFYTSAVGGNIDHAWSISTDNLHNQVGGRAGLQRQETDLKSIRFTRLDTTSKTASAATVSFDDVAEHATYTDHCTGTASLVPGGPDGWLLDRISVSCSRQSPSAPAPAPAAPGKAPKNEGGKGKESKGKGGG